MQQIKYGTDVEPQIEYWFQFENEVDCCPPSSSSSSSSGSSSSSSSSSGGSSSGEGPTVDLVTCNIYNECSRRLVFGQVRLHLPPGAWVEPIPHGLVVLHISLITMMTPALGP